MPKVFVIQNKDGHYLTKKMEYWLDGSEPNALFKTPYHDIALNSLIEYNSKHIDVRAEILEVDSTQKGLPVVEISDIEAKLASKKPPKESPVEANTPEDASDAAPKSDATPTA